MAEKTDPFAEYVVPEKVGTDDPFAQYQVETQPAKVPVPTQPAQGQDFFAAYEEPSKYNKLRKESASYGFGDLVKEQSREARGGTLWTKTTSNEDIQAIADNWKVNPEELRSLAPFYNALPPMDEITLADVIKKAVGGVSYGLAGGVPQFLVKKLQDDNMRNALDDLRELAEGRMGAAEFVGWNLLPVGGAVKAATTPPKYLPALAKGAAIGATYGVAGSREGGEVEGGLIGGAVGAPLAAIATKLAKSRLTKSVSTGEPIDNTKGIVTPSDDVTKNISLEYAKNNEARITDIADEAWSRVKDSEQDIGEAIVYNKQLSDDAVDRIIKEQTSPDTVQIVKDKLGQKLGREATDRDVVDELVRQKKESFSDELLSETPQFGERGVKTADSIVEAASGQGKENLLSKYLQNSYVITGKQQLAKLNIQVNPDAAPVGKLLVNGATDRQFGLKVIDEFTGSNTYKPFLNLNTNYNFFTKENSVNDIKIGNIYKEAKNEKIATDLLNDEGGIFYTLFREGRIGEMSPTMQKVASQVTSFFDGVRERANTMEGTGITPLNIAKKEGFTFPDVLVKPVDYVIKMKQKMGEVDIELKKTLGKDLKSIITETDFEKAKELPSFQELLSGAAITFDKPILDGKDLQLALKEATQRGASNPKLHSVAFTTLQREGSIPEFLKEKNVFKIMKRYSENTMRNVYLREPLAELVNQSKLLDQVGAREEAAFVRRLVGDNLGIRAYSMARLGNEARIKFAEFVNSQLEKRITDASKRKSVVDSFRLIPEMMANIQYNIYPNVLGLNPKAHFAQMTQTWFKNAPEIGGTYGYDLTGKSFLQAVLSLRGPAKKEFYDKVQKYGLEPKSFVKEASEPLADEMERRLLYNVGAKALRTASEASLYFYGKADTFNRAVTANMAERLATDLNNNVAGAFKAVNKMPITIRKELVKNKGNIEEQAKILAMHLNSTTQFNYNRASMSELGTILGPFFSTFTKWPLATAGDIIADLRTKGFQSGGMRAAEKYGATLLLASVLDNSIRYILGNELDIGGDFKDYDERLKKVIGSGGLVSMTPVASLQGLLPGDREKMLFTPPLVDSFWAVFNKGLKGDLEGGLKESGKLLKTYVPGAFVYRMLSEDLPVMVTGEKP